MTQPTIAYQSASRVKMLQGVAEMLEEMVEHLFPYSDIESPEVIWLRNIKARYPLTKLGRPARQALDQAQRINRSQRRHDQLGLCEYQIGLIYLYYQSDCHFAAAQFSEARRQWRFVDQSAAVCLTHFAQGLVHFHEQEYEAALDQYSRAEQLMRRVRFGSRQAARKFLDELTPKLTEARRELLAAMWPPETEPPAPPPVDPPTSNMSEQRQATGSSADEQPAAQEGRPPRPPGAVRPPFSQMERPVPVPAHILQSDQYVWYEVVASDHAQVASELPDGTCLLVEQTAAVGPGKGVILTDGQDGVRTGIAVQPYGIKETSVVLGRICFLGTVVGTQRIEKGKFSVNMQTGKLALDVEEQRRIEIDESRIVGVVVGVWQPGLYFQQP